MGGKGKWSFSSTVTLIYIKSKIWWEFQDILWEAMILLKKAVHFANKFLTVKWLLLLLGDCRSIEEISKNISANNIYLWCFKEFGCHFSTQNLHCCLFAHQSPSWLNMSLWIFFTFCLTCRRTASKIKKINHLKWNSTKRTYKWVGYKFTAQGV